MKKSLTLSMIIALLTLSAWAQPMPTREQVMEAGSKPHLRYTVPENLECTSNLIFGLEDSGVQPSYGSRQGKTKLASLPSARAKELGLAKVTVWNESSKTHACGTILSEEAIIFYEIREDGVKLPRYLGECGKDGKWFNRIKFIFEPEIITQFLQQQTPIIAQAAAPNVTVQAAPTPGTTINNNGAPFPNPLNIALSGLQSGQPIPSEITIRVINETKRDAFQKAESIGKTVMYGGIAVGVGAAPFKIGGAIESLADSRVKTAEINAGAAMYVADQQRTATIEGARLGAWQTKVNEVTEIVTSSEANPQQTANPVSSSNPNIANNPVNNNSAQGGTGNGGVGNGGAGGNAQGGNGYGGQGGTGGTGGTGGSLADGAIHVAGGNANATTGAVTANGGDSNSNATGGTANNGGNTVSSNSDSNSNSNSDSQANGGNVSGSGNSSATGGNSQANGGEGGKVIGSGNSESNSDAKSNSNANLDNKVENGNSIENKPVTTANGGNTGPINNTNTADADAAAQAAADAKAKADAEAAAKNQPTTQPQQP